MLATEAIFAVWIARPAMRAVGGIQWLADGHRLARRWRRDGRGDARAARRAWRRRWLPAATAYLLVLLAVEWFVSPLDVRFVAGMVRRRLSSRPAV